MSALLFALFALGEARGQASSETEGAKDTGSPSWDGSLSASGTLDWGNLDQFRSLARGHLQHQWVDWANALDANAALVWLRPAPAPDGTVLPFLPIGREIAVTNRVTWSPVGRLQLGALVRYESNLLRGIDHRGLGGVGVGVWLVDQPTSHFRAVIAGTGEASYYQSDDFGPEVDDPSRTRGFAGVAGILEGTHSWDDGKSTARGSALLVVNPTALIEHRSVVDGALTLRVIGPVGVQLSGTWLYERVVLIGVDRHDLRANVGISVSAGSDSGPT